MTDKATVFLVSLDTDATAFSTFLRHGAIDLIGDDPPVFTFSLFDPSRQSAQDDIEIMFGRWPRFFASEEALRDTLSDAVLRCFSRNETVSVVLLAGSAARLRASPALSDIIPMLGQQPVYGLRFWSVGVLNCGPDHLDETVRRLVDGDDAPLQSLFLVGNDAQPAGRPLGQDNWASLRLIIDIARDDKNVRESLRPGPDRRSARIQWITPFAAPLNEATKPNDLAGFLNRSLRKFHRIGGGEKEFDRFETDVTSALQRIAPEPNPSPLAGPDPVLPRFHTRIGATRPSAHKALGHVMTTVEKHYTAYEEDVMPGQIGTWIDESEGHAATQLAEIRRQPIALPGGGLAAANMPKTEEQIERIKSGGRKWAIAAAEERREMRGKRDDGSASKSGRRGRIGLKFSDLDEVKDLARVLEAAKENAADLPDWQAAYILPAVPVLILAMVAMLHHQKSGAVTSPLLSLLGQAPPVFFVVAAAMLIAPFVLALAVWAGNRVRSKRDASEVFAKANAIKSLYDRALRAAQLYTINTRSAILASELARDLDEKRVSDPHQRLQQRRSRIWPGDNDGLDDAAAVDDETKRIFLDTAPEDWVKTLIEYWRSRQSAPARSWTISRSGSSQGAATIATEYAYSDDLLVENTYTNVDLGLSMLPLDDDRESGVE